MPANWMKPRRSAALLPDWLAKVFEPPERPPLWHRDRRTTVDLVLQEGAQRAVGGLSAGIGAETDTGQEAALVAVTTWDDDGVGTNGATCRAGNRAQDPTVVDEKALDTGLSRDLQAGVGARDVEETGAGEVADTDVIDRSGLADRKVCRVGEASRGERGCRAQKQAFGSVHDCDPVRANVWLQRGETVESHKTAVDREVRGQNELKISFEVCDGPPGSGGDKRSQVVAQGQQCFERPA